MGRHAIQHIDNKFWRVHIEAWQKSGLTQSEFCRQRQLSRDAFTYWKKRLPPKQKAEPAVNLVPIPFRLPVPELAAKLSAPLCLVMGERYRLEIVADFDPALLEKVVLTLGRIS